MKTVRRGLLIVTVIVLSLLALENAWVFWLMLDLGVERQVWIAAIEFLIYTFLSSVLIWRGRLWPQRPNLFPERALKKRKE